MTQCNPCDNALIFDCDGVLADTERYGHLVAFNQAFDQMGLGFSWSDETYRQLLAVAGGKERLRHYFNQNPQLDIKEQEQTELAAELHRLKGEIYVDLISSGKIPPRVGVKRLILAALDAGWKVGVASTSSLHSVEAVLVSVIGSENRARVAAVLAGDVVPKKKPAPDIYLLALEKLGVDRSNAIVVEDSNQGASAAHAAGLKHIVTVSTYTQGEVFDHASAVVDSLGDEQNEAVLLKGMDILENGLVTLGSLARVLAS